MVFTVRTADAATAPSNAEQEALKALEAGDLRVALTVLMRAYGDAVYQFCRRTLREDALAADVHQQCFVQVYEDLPRYSKKSSLRTWVFGIAHHRCLDALKARRRLLTHVDAGSEIPESEDPSARPEENLVRSSIERALHYCLQLLAPATAAAVTLRFHEGFTYEQMAAISGEKAGTLQARVARSLPVLKKCLEARGGTP